MSNPFDHPDNDNPTEIDSYGNKIWRNSAGQYHREGDKPAVINPNGILVYYKEGKCHREGDKPAVIDFISGSVSYYKEGKYHRDGDKPAFILANGTMSYWKEGKCHRDGDKPAIIYPSGIVEYLENDKLLETRSFISISNKGDKSSVVSHQTSISMPKFTEPSGPSDPGEVFYPPPADKSCLEDKSWVENQLAEIMESVLESEEKADFNYSGLEI